MADVMEGRTNKIFVPFNPYCAYASKTRILISLYQKLRFL